MHPITLVRFESRIFPCIFWNLTDPQTIPKKISSARVRSKLRQSTLERREAPRSTSKMIAVVTVYIDSEESIHHAYGSRKSLYDVCIYCTSYIRLIYVENTWNCVHIIQIDRKHVCVCGCDHEKSILLVLVSFISFVNLTHIFTLHQSIVNLYDYVFNHMYAIDIPYIINVTIIEYTFAVYCISKLIILQNTNHLHTVFRLYHTASCIICAACSMDWSLSFITCTCQDMSVMSCRFQTWQEQLLQGGWDGMRRCWRFLPPPSGLAPQPLELQAPNCQHRTIVEHEVPGSVLMFVEGCFPKWGSNHLNSIGIHRRTIWDGPKIFESQRMLSQFEFPKMEGVLFIFIHKHQVRQNQSPTCQRSTAAWSYAPVARCTKAFAGYRAPAEHG